MQIIKVQPALSSRNHAGRQNLNSCYLLPPQLEPAASFFFSTLPVSPFVPPQLEAAGSAFFSSSALTALSFVPPQLDPLCCCSSPAPPAPVLAGPQLLPAIPAPGRATPAPAMSPARPNRAKVFLSSLISTSFLLIKGFNADAEVAEQTTSTPHGRNQYRTSNQFFPTTFSNR